MTHFVLKNLSDLFFLKSRDFLRGTWEKQKKMLFVHRKSARCPYHLSWRDRTEPYREFLLGETAISCTDSEKWIELCNIYWPWKLCVKPFTRPTRNWNNFFTASSFL